MLDKETRRLKDWAFVPLIRLFAPFTPSQLSVAGLLIGLACAAALWQQQTRLGLALWLLNRIFDGMDGIVARKFGRQTDLGGYIDILCDFGAYAVVPLGLIIGRATTTNLIALACLFATFYINSASWIYLSALLEKRQAGATTRGETTSITMPGGIIGGFATILYYCAFILWPNYFPVLAGSMAVLIVLGIGQRLLWASQQLR